MLNNLLPLNYLLNIMTFRYPKTFNTTLFFTININETKRKKFNVNNNNLKIFV